MISILYYLKVMEVCRNYGVCGCYYGNTCRYYHDPELSELESYHFYSDFTCRCPTQHPLRKTSIRSSSGWVCKRFGVIFASDLELDNTPIYSQPRHTISLETWSTSKCFFSKGPIKMVLFKGPIVYDTAIVTSNGNVLKPRKDADGMIVFIRYGNRQKYQDDEIIV